MDFSLLSCCLQGTNRLCDYLTALDAAVFRRHIARRKDVGREHHRFIREMFREENAPLLRLTALTDAERPEAADVTR